MQVSLSLGKCICRIVMGVYEPLGGSLYSKSETGCLGFCILVFKDSSCLESV